MRRAARGERYSNRNTEPIIMSHPSGQSRTFPHYQSGSGWNAMLPARARAAPPQSRFKHVVIGAGTTWRRAPAG